jgi:AraC family transcriptional regulator
MEVACFSVAADAAREPQGRGIETIVPGERGDAVLVSLDREFFSRKAREALGAEVPAPSERQPAADPLMRGVGNALRGDFRAGRTPSEQFLESLAGVVAIHLARHYASGRTALRAGAGLAPHKLERVQAFVEEHLCEPVRVEQLAAAVHMSPFHFARMFKQATGHPPHVYLTLQRIERAKALLDEGRLALVDVAARVGFQTQGHFTEVFRRYAGTTPRMFRLGSYGRNPEFRRKDEEESHRATA